MVENGIPLRQNDQNLYSWKHLLVHPLKPEHSQTPVTIKDLYGDDIELANFDGGHPWHMLDRWHTVPSR